MTYPQRWYQKVENWFYLASATCAITATACFAIAESLANFSVIYASIFTAIASVATAIGGAIVKLKKGD